MTVLRRICRTVGVAAVLCLAGTATAQAFSWGTLSVSHSGSLRGQGYGQFYRVGYNGGRLESTLSDSRRDDTRTYASAKGYGNNDYLGVDSGRRDDGGSSFVRMSDRTGYSQGSSYGFKGKVRVCQDVSLSPDWCSSYTGLSDM